MWLYILLILGILLIFEVEYLHYLYPFVAMLSIGGITLLSLMIISTTIRSMFQDVFSLSFGGAINKKNEKYRYLYYVILIILKFTVLYYWPVHMSTFAWVLSIILAVIYSGILYYMHFLKH